MHELFELILDKKDLSRAGELFAISDAEISEDLSEIVSFDVNLIFDLLLTLDIFYSF